MALLETIAGERACPCQRLRDQFPVSKATISHHIKELVRAGLVDARREGQYLHCEVRREVLARLHGRAAAPDGVVGGLGSEPGADAKRQALERQKC